MSEFRKLNARRGELIIKQIESGLTNEEDLELEILQGRVSELLLDRQVELISEETQRRRIESRRLAGL